MATTSNYGWTTPDDSSLVKDGAAAIRSLGSAIDTSMNTALGTKKAGLVLLNTTSFSAVASQSLPANTFTSTYSHYKLIFNVTGSGVLWIRGRMRTGSTDATTGYKYQEIYAAGASLSASRSTTYTEFLDLILTGNGTINGIGFFELSHPQETKPTGLLTQNLAVTGTPEFTLRSQVLDNTTSYDSMTFYPTSGTMSGSISVYGFNK